MKDGNQSIKRPAVLSLKWSTTLQSLVELIGFYTIRYYTWFENFYFNLYIALHLLTPQTPLSQTTIAHLCLNTFL